MGLVVVRGEVWGRWMHGDGGDGSWGLHDLSAPRLGAREGVRGGWVGAGEGGGSGWGFPEPSVSHLNAREGGGRWHGVGGVRCGGWRRRLGLNEPSSSHLNAREGGGRWYGFGGGEM